MTIFDVLRMETRNLGNTVARKNNQIFLHSPKNLVGTLTQNLLKNDVAQKVVQ
jgi:hypothetical protein